MPTAGPLGFAITGENLSMLGSGIKTVTTAGTAEKLVAAHTASAFVVITALPSNTKYVAIGDSNVKASTYRGIALDIGEKFGFSAKQIEGVYVDVTVSGEGVAYQFFG